MAVMLCPGITRAQATVETEQRADAFIYNKVAPAHEASLASSTSAEPWQRKWYLKTNAAVWAFAIANIAGEVDIARHWSISLPLCYSAWDYFSSTVKFRILSFQPEARYWFGEQNDQWFVGAHTGFAYYNIATGGDYRIQDRQRDTPAWGVGICAGYRLPLNERWKMEFSLGFGVYPVDYDKFINQYGAMLVYTESKTYVGLDQLNISFAYTFDFKKGGGQ
ncbi:MAG: DUF3575 domain-containing protein [Bacteroidaceae bacterium]|nr:DUF3575 domain-containing protein [Bacteroidaceae bacterium]